MLSSSIASGLSNGAFGKLSFCLGDTHHLVDFCQGRHDRLYLHGPHPRKTMVWNHGLHPLRTMVLKSPSAATSTFFSIARCQGGDFQDHGSEGVQTMVQDHGFARVGTMQVQAIMPPLILGSEEQIPLFLWVECTVRILADFVKTTCFQQGTESPFSKKTVSTTLIALAI